MKSEPVIELSCTGVYSRHLPSLPIHVPVLWQSDKGPRQGQEQPVPSYPKALQAYSIRAGPQLLSLFRSEDGLVALASPPISRGFDEM